MNWRKSVLGRGQGSRSAGRTQNPGLETDALPPPDSQEQLTLIQVVGPPLQPDRSQRCVRAETDSAAEQPTATAYEVSRDEVPGRELTGGIVEGAEGGLAVGGSAEGTR